MKSATRSAEVLYGAFYPEKGLEWVVGAWIHTSAGITGGKDYVFGKIFLKKFRKTS